MNKNTTIDVQTNTISIAKEPDIYSLDFINAKITSYDTQIANIQAQQQPWIDLQQQAKQGGLKTSEELAVNDPNTPKPIGEPVIPVKDNQPPK